jgi:hypothetical protein
MRPDRLRIDQRADCQTADSPMTAALTGPDPLDKRTIARLIAKLREAPAEEDATGAAPGPRSLPLFGWDAYQNPAAVLERRDDRVLIARLLAVVDQRLPAGVDLVDLQLRWKPIGEVRLDESRTAQIRNWLAETVYLSLLAAHLVKASPQQAGAQITFRTPYLAWWRFGTLLITQTHPLPLGVSPEVVSGTSYAGLAWYAPERGWIQGRGQPGLWGHRVLNLGRKAVETSRIFRPAPALEEPWPEITAE